MEGPIPYTKPNITELEVEYAADAIRNGWGSRCYDYIERLEKSFAEYIGTKYAIATSSCTGALTLGLAAMGIRGKTVMLADTNWIATVAPVVQLGGKPNFVDIRPNTWCLQTETRPETDVIIATHLYGNLCQMSTLLDISDTYGIPIIEDAAEALGSEYWGRKAGSMGLFGVFSFHGTKLMTTGEGGMLVTNNEDLYRTALILSNHGRNPAQTKMFWPEMVGYKFKMSNVQAAIGCAQLERIEELLTVKREVFYFYEYLFEGLPVTMNPEREGEKNSFWMPTVVFDEDTGVTREILLDAFRNAGIDARPFFWPLSSLPMFPAQDNPNAYSIAARAVNLPSYAMTFGEQQRVVNTLKGVIGENK